MCFFVVVVFLFCFVFVVVVVVVFVFFLFVLFCFFVFALFCFVCFFSCLLLHGLPPTDQGLRSPSTLGIATQIRLTAIQKQYLKCLMYILSI